MTHAHAHHALLLTLALVFGASSAVGCESMSGDIAHRVAPGSEGGDYGSTGDQTTGDVGSTGEQTTGGYGSTGEPDGDGCTLTQGYWKTHHKYAKNLNQQLPWPLSEDTLLCGQTWLDILHTAPQGNAFYIAAFQWIAAQLNIAAGAPAPAEIHDAIAKLTPFLEMCVPCAEGKAKALELAALLDAFNNGEVGPGHCDKKEDPGMIEGYDFNADICNGQVKGGKQLELKTL